MTEKKITQEKREFDLMVFAAEGKRCPDQTERTVSMAMEILPHSRNLATLKLENK